MEALAGAGRVIAAEIGGCERVEDVRVGEEAALKL